LSSWGPCWMWKIDFIYNAATVTINVNLESAIIYIKVKYI